MAIVSLNSEYVVIKTKKYGPIHYPAEEIVGIVNKGAQLLVQFKIGREVFYPSGDVTYNKNRFLPCQ